MQDNELLGEILKENNRLKAKVAFVAGELLGFTGSIGEESEVHILKSRLTFFLDRWSKMLTSIAELEFGEEGG
ncbi:MAG: hypothetical protein LBN05_08435 [Oscillospiraceae bacterium]|jgi:hypothetical protein|nr:hypothetical protein [Oscillospiraceae bacterium]